jgi:hypothetical protein
MLVGTALAGPPLICHPFAIGNDQSLPWKTDGKSWDSPDPAYDTTNLVRDTFKLLDSGKPLLTRMETLRRAAVYAKKDPAAGLNLANRLTARALAAEVKGEASSLALFDAGYFAETMKQMALITKSTAFADIDGYEWIRRSVPALDEKLVAEYAMGLIESRTSWPNEHIRRAVMGAQEGSLLAENLRNNYQAKNLSEIKRTLASR